MINSKRQLTKYVLSDYVMSNVAWLIFNIIRFFIPVVTSGYAELGDFLLSRNVVIGQIFMPIIMMLVYYLSGYYNIIFFKSRLHELFTTIGSVTINTLILFFTTLINDIVPLRSENYELILILLQCNLFLYTRRDLSSQPMQHTRYTIDNGTSTPSSWVVASKP